MSLINKKQRIVPMQYANQNGFSLLEVMISLVLVSFGLISITNHQMRSVNASMVTYTETQGTLYIQELSEILRINKEAAANGEYNITLGSLNDLPSERTTTAEIERYNWFKNLNTVLPSAEAAINCTSDYHCTLSLQHNYMGSVQDQSLAVIL